MLNVKGIGASIGVSVGQSYLYENDVNFDIPIVYDYFKATELLIEKFNSQILKFKKNQRADEAEVLEAYVLILNDPEIVAQIDQLEELSPKNIYEVFDSTSQIFKSMEDVYFQQRAEDIISVGKHLIFSMQKVEFQLNLKPGTILLAKDLTPADTSSMNLNNVSGILLKEGGLTSHAVIVAKNLGIPCVIGLGKSLDNVRNDINLAMDGETGEVIISPSLEVINTLEKKQFNQQYIVSSFSEEKYHSLGVEFRINIGSSEEINTYNHQFLNSIGLFRSEFIYLDKKSSPNLEEQIKILNNLGKKFSGTIVYRTLDIGGDKQVEYLNLPNEENPFLGVRGIRLSLEQKELFSSQIKSILLSDCLPRVKIMFPMIATLEDFFQAKTFIEDIAKELNTSVPPLGIMIETPSSVLMIDKFVKVVDFVSIGTNDLTQYIMAADRGNANLRKYQDPLHPSVLRSISNVIETSKKSGVEVSVCGEMASDPVSALVLYKLGLKVFSMSPSAAPYVFEAISKGRKIEKSDMRNELLNADNPEEVRLLINKLTT